MGRSVTLGNGRDIDKDIELCRTTNEKTSEQTIHVLMENHIPFTKSWINIPFFLRRKFHGASQILSLIHIFQGGWTRWENFHRQD